MRAEAERICATGTDEDAKSALMRLDRFENPPRDYIEANLKVQNKKDGRLVPFKFKSVQARADAIAEDMRLRGLPVFLIFLKYRQGGISTWTEGRGYEHTRRIEGQRAFIIGNELENSNHLYRMYTRFHKNEPQSLPLETGNRKELIYAHPHNSHIVVSTAAKAQAGTGHTNHFVHISELAKWPNPDDTMLSLMQTIPDDPNSVCIIEFTAQGVGGLAYDMYWDAKNGKSSQMGPQFQAVFLAWFEDQEYFLPMERGEELEGLGIHPRYNEYEDEENILIEKHECSMDQMKWRRYCIDFKCGGSVAKFHQEYPSTDEEAFLSSGKPVFPVGVVKSWKKIVVPSQWKGRLVREGGMNDIFSSPLMKSERPDIEGSIMERIVKASEFMHSKVGYVDTELLRQQVFLPIPQLREALVYSGFKESNNKGQYIKAIHAITDEEQSPSKIIPIDDPKGFIDVWEWPVAEEVYTMGVDTAMGENVEIDEGDNDACWVLKKRGLVPVARIWGKMPVDVFARNLWMVGTLYHRALMVVEIQAQGWAVLDKLRNCYGNLFKRPSYNQDQLRQTGNLGFHTNPATKPILEDDLVALIRNEICPMPDDETLDELLSYVRHDDGSTGAQKGRKDDLAVAYMLAVQGAKVSTAAQFLRHFNANTNVVREGVVMEEL